MHFNIYQLFLLVVKYGQTLQTLARKMLTGILPSHPSLFNTGMLHPSILPGFVVVTFPT